MPTRRTQEPTAKKTRSTRPRSPALLEKAPSGIAGLDQVTYGGLPKGRPTLVCGGPGSGKTLLALEFAIRGAELFGEPAVFVAFEETPEELAKNVASLGFDLERLVREKKLVVEHVHVDPTEIEEAGEYNLEGLFVRLRYAIDAIGAKRVAIDTLEVIFGGFSDSAMLRAEIARLLRWLKEIGVSAIVTGERGDSTLTRQGLEEYVSDCVILLDQRVHEQVTTRRLRVVKYRGTAHGTNEYPFLIGDKGISVLPITSSTLEYDVTDERISSGIRGLDEMLSGKGFFRTGTILLSGCAGTGKSILSARIVIAACARGERCLMFALEESPAQMVRNMRSVGLDLQKWIDKGLLRIHAARPTVFGLEMHLVHMHAHIEAFGPKVVVIDPVSSFVAGANQYDVKSMLVRLFDYLKMHQITCVVTYLSAPTVLEQTEMGISSLIDTWIELRDLETMGERNRGIYIIKSRGMAHSNQVREFVIGDAGIDLVDVYSGPEGILAGSARVAQEARAKADERVRKEELLRKERSLERRRKAIRAQIEALEAEYAAEEAEVETLAGLARERQQVTATERAELLRARKRGTAVT